jgi:hypothetical protein
VDLNVQGCASIDVHLPSNDEFNKLLGSIALHFGEEPDVAKVHSQQRDIVRASDLRCSQQGPVTPDDDREVAREVIRRARGDSMDGKISRFVGKRDDLKPGIDQTLRDPPSGFGRGTAAGVRHDDHTRRRSHRTTRHRGPSSTARAIAAASTVGAPERR